MDHPDKFANDNIENDENYDRNGRDERYDPSVAGDSAILWSDNPERQYLEARLEMERQRRIAEGRDAGEDSLLGLSTQADLLYGPTVPGAESNTREDYSLATFERDFATVTTANEDRKVEIENFPPPPPPPPPPPGPVFRDFYGNVPDQVYQDMEAFSPPPEQKIQPQLNPPSSSTPPSNPASIVPPIIYIAGPNPAHVAVKPPLNDSQSASGRTPDGDTANTSASTVSDPKRDWRACKFILPLALLFILLTAALISALLVQNRISNPAVGDDSATNAFGDDPVRTSLTTPPIPPLATNTEQVNSGASNFQSTYPAEQGTQPPGTVYTYTPNLRPTGSPSPALFTSAPIAGAYPDGSTGTTPGATDSYAPFPGVSISEGTTPVTTPEGTTPGVTTPEGSGVTTPEGSGVTTPEGTAPGVSPPEGTAPGANNPGGTTPGEGTTPGIPSPEGTTPGVTTPEGTTPEAIAAGASAPGVTPLSSPEPTSLDPRPAFDFTLRPIIPRPTGYPTNGPDAEAPDASGATTVSPEGTLPDGTMISDEDILTSNVPLSEGSHPMSYQPEENNVSPSATSSPEPTRRPTRAPTRNPTRRPTRRPVTPTARPTRSQRPTGGPTPGPTRRPTRNPTMRPTRDPARNPTSRPTRNPTRNPTVRPTRTPTREPTRNPTRRPSRNPTRSPTRRPTRRPTEAPELEPTNSPTDNVERVTPRSFTFSSLRSLVHYISPNSADALYDEESSQYKALEWLLEDPGLELYTDSRITQRWVMATVFLSTNGFAWSNIDDSLSRDTHECEWLVGWGSRACNDDDQLVVLDLEGNNLVGTIPLEIGLLSDTLERIYLPRNDVVGTLPTEIGQLTKLQRLDLGRCDLTGTLPTEIGHLRRLRVLALGRNDFQGTLPTQLGRLTKLEFLSLERNNLRGTVPTQLGRLVELEYLGIDWNELRGTMPTEISNLTKLRDFFFARNHLDGEVDDVICPLPNLDSTAADCTEFTTCECCDICCEDGGSCFSQQTEEDSSQP